MASTEVRAVFGHHGERTLLLTVEQAAAELHIARRRVYEMIRPGGPLPSVKIGNSRRIRSADLADYVARLTDDKVPA
jgi:excisionase family DNA binding protein